MYLLFIIYYPLSKQRYIIMYSGLGEKWETLTKNIQVGFLRAK
jgi:hypothetical protein